jgi:hypothetical protein
MRSAGTRSFVADSMLARHLINITLNHRQEKPNVREEEVSDALHSLVEDGRLEEEDLSRLRVELGWLQYKQNFREPVMVADSYHPGNGKRPHFRELLIDTRRVSPETLKKDILRALAEADAIRSGADSYRVPIEDFKPFRNSVAWAFNQTYWAYFSEWEQWTGQGYEKALPGGISDAHHPLAVADGVADFWTVLKELDAKKQLPQEIFFLEIGVGTGTRCGMFLDQFRALDQKRGTNYYPRLRVLLGDYSLATLDSSLPAVRDHAELCSFLVLDAMHPLKTLSFLREKILHIHTTNVYDNLPNQEFVRHEGKLYSVEARAYLPLADVRRISAACGVPVERFRQTVEKFAESGPDYFAGHARGMTFWQETWKALRLEERLVALDDLTDSPFPEGLTRPMLEDILANAPTDFRFQVSSGALESFMRTLPLLHPRGYFQVQDIFVKDFRDYQRGFRGPGKMDGSIVNWVNGALLKGVAERIGYDVHFAPFHYRKGALTSVMYATRQNAEKKQDK